MHHVEVLCCAGCPHCLNILDRVTDACINAGTVTEIHAVDTARHPEEVRSRFGLSVSPVVVVDGRVVSSGAAPSFPEFARLLAAPDQER